MIYYFYAFKWSKRVEYFDQYWCSRFKLYYTYEKLSFVTKDVHGPRLIVEKNVYVYYDEELQKYFI